MSVVGLDFGTQNAVIAVAGRGGVDVVLNGNSQRLNPCMVSFTSNGRSKGEGAASSRNSNFKTTLTSMKRLVGLSFDDPRAQKEMSYLPFTCVPLDKGIGVDVSNAYFALGEGEKCVVSMEHALGIMVAHMGNDIAGNPADWVIAIPSNYTDAQRRAFLTGCEIVGITNVLRLMHEHTAVALAYGIFKDIRKEFANQEKPTNVMFIDMGASQFNVSICAFEPGKLTVKSSHCDADLGGRDFDKIITDWCLDKFAEKYGSKLSCDPKTKPKVVLKTLVAAEKAKKTLSPAGVKEVRINLECLMDDLDFADTLTAEEYEALCEPLLARLEGPVKRCLEEAGLSTADLSNVEIVGGGTRVSSVKKRLASILGLQESGTNCGLSTTMNADEAVARGTALQAAILSPRFKVLPYEIIEANPFPINVSWEGEDGIEVSAEGEDAPTNSVVMFGRNSNFPTVKRVSLKRAGEFVVNAGYDDSAVATLPKGTPKQICKFTIKAPAGEEKRVRVNVKEDVHGIISLSSAQMVEEIEEPAEETSEEKKTETGTEDKKEEKKKKVKKTNLEFTEMRPLEWSKNEINAANSVEVEMANADRVIKETADLRNELEAYIYAMRDRILDDLSPYGSDDDKAAFENALETIENWLYEDGFDAKKSVYAEKLGELKKFGNPMEFRQEESQMRPAAQSALQSTVEKYKNFLNSASSDEKYSHITEEEKQRAHAKCDEVSSWMYDMLDKQGSLPSSADPAATVAQINAKTKEVVDVCAPVMNKPKPKPAPAPAPTPEPAKAEEKSASVEEEKKEDGMDVDSPAPVAEDAKPEGEAMDTSA